MENTTLKREKFTSHFGLLMTMIGVAVGLGNIWRFPYMVGLFGGASFVVFYLLMVLLIGIPAIMAEWTLGRYTRKGPLGAFEKGGMPGGKYFGYFLFCVVFFATAYYSNTLGWVLYYAFGEISVLLSISINSASVLPPNAGFNISSFLLQMVMAGLIIGICGFVLFRGLKNGIERVSKFIIPFLAAALIVLIVRSVTLDGAGAGIKWFIGDFQFEKLTGTVMAAALGQAVFSMSLGGTYMVVYGSYLNDRANIPKNALFTGLGDTTAGLLAGFAIFPAVFAFGLNPDSGPSLLFNTLPNIFERIPAGGFFGLLFYTGLLGAALLSNIAAFEVLIAGITDNTAMKRKKAVVLVCIIVFALAIPTMVNMKIFIPWDLVFGSGMQVLGGFFTVITTVWFLKRSKALKEIAIGYHKPFPLFLYWWMRLVIPAAIIFVGINWLRESVF